MEFSPGTLGALLLVANLAAVAALVVAVVALQGQRRVRATYQRFSRGSREDVITLLDRHIAEVQALRAEVRRQKAYADHLRLLESRTVSRLGMVRYDAFDDMGGRLSFSLALLDEHGDGTVLTAMNGRVQTRTYAKPVVAGTSPHNLSEEEVQAIEQAMTSGRRRTPPPPPEATTPDAIETEAAAEPANDAGGEGETAPLGSDHDTTIVRSRRSRANDEEPAGVVDAAALLDES